MLRIGVARSVARSLSKSVTFNSRNGLPASIPKPRFYSDVKATGFRSASSVALTLYKPNMTALLRHASTSAGSPGDHIDTKHESKVSHQTLVSHPEQVSVDSSVRHTFSEEGTAKPEEHDVDMMAGIKADIKTIRETFSLEEVPKQALYIGMAGVIPYLATSLSTVFLAWNINHASVTGNGILMTGKTSELLLHIVEPLQVGYGAVIISFLGAIHWGLEWAKFGGEHGYARYAPGVIAPAIAWPTTLMPVEYALISQFLAFNYMYYTDARAARRGWAPRWYGVYRYVLTFVVGASIVVSLIGRGQIAHEIGRPSGAADRVKALRDSQLEGLEEEERARRARAAKDEDGDDDDEE